MRERKSLRILTALNLGNVYFDKEKEEKVSKGN